MMIISLNQETDNVSILSVPRDLYVVIPGRGRDRINTAFVYGSSDGNPANGAALSMQTIEYNLGVRLDHYILVDFAAVINGVNAIGGIDVNVPFNVSDPTYPDMNYGYDPLFIPAGLQHFDGTMALKYARTRHMDSDFGRAQRQQQVVLAVRDRLLDMGVTSLLGQAPTLWQQVEEGIRSDLSLQQISQLGLLANDISSENIRNEVLNQNYVSNYTTETGAQVLILNNDKAAPLIESLFYDN
jgi:LCP family protein required for cell wall assembly